MNILKRTFTSFDKLDSEKEILIGLHVLRYDEHNLRTDFWSIEIWLIKWRLTIVIVDKVE